MHNIDKRHSEINEKVLSSPDIKVFIYISYLRVWWTSAHTFDFSVSSKREIYVTPHECFSSSQLAFISSCLSVHQTSRDMYFFFFFIELTLIDKLGIFLLLSFFPSLSFAPFYDSGTLHEASHVVNTLETPILYWEKWSLNGYIFGFAQFTEC